MKYNNKALNESKKNTKDNNEFYAIEECVEEELLNPIYMPHFYGKSVFCNCNDGNHKGIVNVLIKNFDVLKLKSICFTSYEEGGRGMKYVFDGTRIHLARLHGDGSFLSEECVELLDKHDIVVTGPPFGLGKEFIMLLMEHKKKFLVILNITQLITYNPICDLFVDGKIWTGTSIPGDFLVPDDYDKKVKIKDGKKIAHIGNACWVTNIAHNINKYPLIMTKSYNEEEYPKYSNFNVINVERCKNIPSDYMGVMGVPVTFIQKHHPLQFEILGLVSDDYLSEYKVDSFRGNFDRPYFEDKRVFAKLAIRRIG